MNDINIINYLEGKYFLYIFRNINININISRSYIITYKRNDYEIFNELEYMIGFKI